MNEKAWHDIFKKYIKCYEAVETIKKYFDIDDDYYQELISYLLEDIIVTFKSEVE